MKDFTDRRLGVWYPIKPFTIHVYDRCHKRWTNIMLFCDDPVVFMADYTEENRNPGHALFIRGTSCWHSRLNRAHWNKRFSR